MVTSSRKTPLLPIFAISLLVLFLELTLIRWIATEVRIFAYLQNTILVVCFLGLGMGAFTSRGSTDLKPGLVRLFMLVALLGLPGIRELFRHVSGLLSLAGGFVIWEGLAPAGIAAGVFAGTVGLLLTFLIMFLTFHAFVPLGRVLGRRLDEHPRPIAAYSADIAGSLAGVWLAISLGALQTPPVVWFALIAVLSVPFLDKNKRKRRLEVALLGGVVACSAIASIEPGTFETRWSPYQKLTLVASEFYTDRQVPGDPILNVNNTGYQGMLDLRPASILNDPSGQFNPRLIGYSQYDLPFRFHANPQRVLLVGGGSGNDAAGAIRQDVEDITVVEIDPAIIAMGRRHHPEQPYSDSRVTVVNDDARGFFSKSAGDYDVIVFGLLDSHTTLGMTNARLDHYVYTRESIEMARGLLAPGGIVFLSFEAERPYIADRMAGVLNEVFGERPINFRVPATAHGWGGAVFVAGNTEVARSLIHDDQHLASLLAEYQEQWPMNLTYDTRVATDDWPYIYLEGPSIPPLFVLLAILVSVLYLVGRKMTGAPRVFQAAHSASWHFFFLGAAFLLLEVQNISKATIALGSTWWVTAVIISGVLTMVLLANLTSATWPRLRLGGVYVALLASCVALYWVDLAAFASMPFLLKAPLVGAVATVPMYFSGIIFIRSFASTPSKDVAFGANLLGAMLGALLEPITFLLGVKFLLLIVAGFYVLSWMTLPQGRTSRVRVTTGRIAERLAQRTLVGDGV